MNLLTLHTACMVGLLTAASASAQEADTAVSAIRRGYEHRAMVHRFVHAPYQNPAMSYYRYHTPLSAISTTGEYKSESTPLTAEEGDGWKGFGVNASSYTLLSRHSRLWGEASYRNGRRMNVVWNENSDFEVLYPYVVADSIGGNMKNETYFFDGGYAWKEGRWTFGGELSYKAVLEYRDTDPRPRNLSARITGKAGASYLLSTRYAVGLSAQAHKYRQEGSIEYYNELGVSKTYHLSGLGMSYTRFNGSRTNTDYQGREFGGTLSILPVTPQGGWQGTFSYLHSTLDKTLPDVNDIELNNLAESTLTVETGWLSASTHGHSWGVKAAATHAIRRGTENLFGDPSGNQYPWISKAEQFKRVITTASVSGFYEHTAKAWRWSAVPSLCYTKHQETYHSPYKELSYSILQPNLTLTADYLQQKNTWHLSLKGMHTSSLHSELTPGNATTPFAAQILEQDFRMQSHSRATYALTARWSNQLFRRMAVYAQVSWQQTVYNGLGEDARQGICTLGVEL